MVIKIATAMKDPALDAMAVMDQMLGVEEILE